MASAGIHERREDTQGAYPSALHTGDDSMLINLAQICAHIRAPLVPGSIRGEKHALTRKQFEAAAAAAAAAVS